MVAPPAPFTVRVLPVSGTSDRQSTPKDFTALLPATSRPQGVDANGNAAPGGSGTVVAPIRVVTPQLGVDFLEQELLVKRLDDIARWLWVCGRPMPARPLHYQVLRSRDIVVTEDVGLHLVWFKNRIFVKPIPLYLLDPDFWNEYLSSKDRAELMKSARGTEHLSSEDRAELAASLRQVELAESARGFLFSYCGLISYESDFRIAQEKGLVPAKVAWAAWKTLSKQLLENDRYARVSLRYWYGELRLGRLNKVYQLRKGYLLRGYSRVAGYTTYFEFLGDNFAVLAALLGYTVVVLTALQVGLVTTRLQSNDTFQSASYGFTIFSMLAPLFAVTGIVGAMLIMFIDNWRATDKFEKSQFKDMGVSHPRESEKESRRKKKGTNELEPMERA